MSKLSKLEKSWIKVQSAYEELIINAPKMVSKKWGYELWIHNDHRYCGKILFFNKGAKFSMHFHIQKHKTWYVAKGKLLLKGINPKNAEKYETELEMGDVIEIHKGQPHQLYAIKKSEIFEISTEHFNNDTYKIEASDSQKK